MQVYNFSGRDIWIDGNLVKEDCNKILIDVKDLDILGITGEVIGRLSENVTRHFVLFGELPKPVQGVWHEFTPFKGIYKVGKGRFSGICACDFSDPQENISVVVDGTTVKDIKQKKDYSHITSIFQLVYYFLLGILMIVAIVSFTLSRQTEDTVQRILIANSSRE